MPAVPIPKPLPEEALDYVRSLGIDPFNVREDGWAKEGYLAFTGQPGEYTFTDWPKDFSYTHLVGILQRARADEDEFSRAVREQTSAIASMLIEKNEAYGNSALDPVRIFSDASPEEQLLVRIDDKLSRLQRGSEFADEDTVADLIGYLILLKIARK